ncbi:anti-sigma factor [Roseobacter sinensis]|uniref:Zinc-finger domain-containing protein n=1 Tax=Roseobacter sinensis TaxID=2931391 RepID=A0ABT3BGQ0_9RHOB|nr:hypothetical protein [Roseobacter sp. WL0113]MCV3272743.1 hypothetical protein [Roseobacter sp. WL0113]
MDRDQNILDYLQDRLTAADREAFEAAMAQDGSLAAEVSVMRSVRAQLAAAPKHESADAVWQRLSAEMESRPPAANDDRPPWQQLLKYAAVAVLAVAAWQVTIVPRMGEAPGGFRTASEQPAAFTFQVKFVESATLGEIAAVLGPLGGTITDGPSALGLVRLSFAEAGLRDEALKALEGQVELVEFVAD